MGIGVYEFGVMFNDSGVLLLISQILIGAAIYVLLSVIARNPTYKYIINKIKKSGYTLSKKESR